MSTIDILNHPNPWMNITSLDDEWAILEWTSVVHIDSNGNSVIYRLLYHRDCNVQVNRKYNLCSKCLKEAPKKFLTLIELLNLDI